MIIHTTIHQEITFNESNNALKAITLLEAEVNGVRKLARAIARQGHYERSDDLYAQARRLGLVLDLLGGHHE